MTREEAIKIVKEFINGTCLHLVDREALEVLIPELLESEDERIRKHIVTFLLEADKMGDAPEEVAKWLAYLEKQKVDIDKLRKDIYQSGYNDGYQHGKEDAQKEQKPIDVRERPFQGIVVDKLKYIVPSWYDGAQKPAEWSEVEEKDIQEASEYFRDYANNYVQGGNSKLYIQSLADRVESLRPQPKQEWNEEDEYIINTLIHHYELINPTSSYFDKVPKERFLAWLKSLRPFWKPSEEQMAAFAEALARLTNQDMDNRTYANLCELKSGLKKLM